MNHHLKNKRALITGGSRGIGAAIVKRLADEGADVALTYVNKPDQADAIVDAVRALGVRGVAMRADSADAHALPDAYEGLWLRRVYPTQPRSSSSPAQRTICDV